MDVIRVELVNEESFINIAAIAISVISLALSLISLWRQAGGLRITSPVLCNVPHPLCLMLSDGSLQRVYLELENEEYWLITMRVVNPKEYPVTIFNINIVNENGERVDYLSNAALPKGYKGEKLLIRIRENTLIGITLPESDFLTLGAGEFTHVDFLIKKETRFSSLTLYFRDTLITPIPHKMKLPNSSFMRHRVRRYKFSASNSQQWIGTEPEGTPKKL